MDSLSRSSAGTAPQKPPGKPPRGTVVRGVLVPERRFTPWAGLYFAGFVCLPFLAFCLALDLLLYFLFRHAFDSCYALLCLLD